MAKLKEKTQEKFRFTISYQVQALFRLSFVIFFQGAYGRPSPNVKKCLAYSSKCFRLINVRHAIVSSQAFRLELEALLFPNRICKRLPELAQPRKLRHSPSIPISYPQN